jgi:molybdopterin/thiamine biosynthesis adenylyltransferase
VWRPFLIVTIKVALYTGATRMSDLNADTDALFSRERLAGYDPLVLASRAVLVVGAGAGGSNVIQNLALSGVGDIRLVDCDRIEVSNITRSPLFSREAARNRLPKAQVAARAALELSHAMAPAIRFAGRRIEELGLAVFAGVAVVVSCVDSWIVRAYLSDCCRLLGIPLVEGGFGGHAGNQTVFQNAAADEPCWRCLHPDVPTGRAPCSLYAHEVESQGMVPATQPLAATFGGLAAQAAIGASHGEFPLGGSLLHLDTRTGRCGRFSVTPHPECPGVHRLLGEPVPIPIHVTDTLGALLRMLEPIVRAPVVRLRSPFVVEAPCDACGGAVKVMAPLFALDTAPRCEPGSCRYAPTDRGFVAISAVDGSSGLGDEPLSRFGFVPGDIVDVGSLDGEGGVAVRLAGDAGALFTTLVRPSQE